jgi:hypothetical protein
MAESQSDQTAKLIKELLESNKNQQESIKKLIDMNHHLMDEIDEQKFLSEIKKTEDSKNHETKTRKDYITAIYKSSYIGNGRKFRLGDCYELIFDMSDDKVFEALCIELTQICSFKLMNSNIIRDGDGCVLPLPYTIVWPPVIISRAYYAEVYRFKHFVNINCSEKTYKDIVAAGLFNDSILINREIVNSA